MKDKDEGTGFIKTMRILKKVKNRKDLDMDSDTKHDDDPPLHSFYITDSEYKENTDSYAQISNKMIKVYDKEMNLRLRFEGLQIRYCEDVHQSYLYTISDQIHRQPYIYSSEDDFAG